MKRIIFFILLVFIISCSSKTESNFEEIEEYVEEENGQKISDELRKKIRGVWASEEYKNLLFESNSVTEAEKSITTYTDIIFDGEEFLHCNKPSFMEEAYLYLNADSTATTYEGDFEFKIIAFDNNIMTIKSSTEKTYKYKRVVENPDLSKMFQEITKGTTRIENQWLAGNYNIQLDSLMFNAELSPKGEIKSTIEFKWIAPFSYKGIDFIEFRFENDSTLLYSIETYSDTLITLSGYESIMELDAPVVQNGKIGRMKRK